MQMNDVLRKFTKRGQPVVRPCTWTLEQLGSARRCLGNVYL